MGKYRKTMLQAIQEGATAQQVQNLKKAYEPMRNKTISFSNAQKLQGIFDRFDSNKDLLKALFKADIPFVSGMASSRLITKHGLNAQHLMQIRKEGIESALKDLQQINHGPWLLDEGKMSQIDQMQKDGASAEEIAKKLKVKVSIVKGILGEDSNTTYKVKKDGKVVFTGKYNQVLTYRKQHGGEIVTEETLVEYTDKQIKMAFGILNDPRYKSGNYSGAYKAIEKLAKGLANHPSVANALKRANESVNEKFEPGFAVRYLDPKNGKRLVAAYKTKKDADDKAAQLKKDGAKDITITKHDLNFKEQSLKSEEVEHAMEISGVENDGREEVNDGREELKESIEEAMPGGANSSSKKGSVWKKHMKAKLKKNYMKKAEHEPKLAEEAKDMAVGQRISFDQLSQSLKDLWTEAADEKKIEKKVEKKPDAPAPVDDDMDKKDAEIALLKQKAVADKAKTTEKATKKMVNPETGEPLLQIGIAYKHIRDKLKKEKEKNKEEVKESEDYLRSKLSSSQIANIKATWKNKKATDVTASVKDMIKKMDIPTQLAIKHADIPHISKLVEGKYTRYSNLLIQKGRMQKAGDKLGEKDTDKEINKEKQKLGIKEGVEVQVIKKGSGPINKRSHAHDFKNRADAEKWIKWYKTGGSLYKKSEIEKILIHETITELSTNSKLPNLVGQSIAHLELYLELVKNINKIPSGKEVPYMVKIQSKTASTSLPPVIKDLRKPGIFEQVNEQRETFVNILNETDKDSAHAIGMAKAKEKFNDEPPLEKKTIKKAHDIADKIMANEVHPSKDTYERITRGK